MRVSIVALNSKYIHTALSIYNLSEYAKLHLTAGKWDFALSEFTINQDKQDILGNLYHQQADTYAFSCYIWNIKEILEIAQMLKKVLPNTVIILGGPEVSYNAADILKKYIFLDYVVEGSGEATFVKILREISFNATSSLKDISSNTTTNVLDEVPFPYQSVDLRKAKGKIIYYEASRGCPFSCSYCISGREDEVLQFRSLEKVKKELQTLINANVAQIKFVDRTFNVDKKLCLSIWDFLNKQESHVKTNFHFEIVAELLDNEMLDFLQTVPKGRFQFEIGIQTTCENTLAAIGRNDSWLIIENVIKKIKKFANIHVHLDLIVGLPLENDAAMRKSFDDVYNLKPDMLQLGFLKMLHGSALREQAELYGYLYNDCPPYNILSNAWMSFEEIEKWRKVERLLESYYNKRRCCTTIEYLISVCCNNSVSGFYHSLVDYWLSLDLYSVAHKPFKLYKILWEYCKCVLDVENCKKCCDLLRFDACREGFGEEIGQFMRNEEEKVFVSEQSWFWRDEELVQKYISTYKFESWRRIHNNYMLESFSVDIVSYLHSGILQERKSVILFDKVESSFIAVDSERLVGVVIGYKCTL